METFKRNQVEQAIWNRFVKVQGRDPKIPSVFRTRIRRLLDLDRQGGAASTRMPCMTRYAFQDNRPRGRGTDISFSPFNAFCLAVGLDLLDMGLKQSEIVFLLRHIRPALQTEYSDILKNPPEFRNRIPAEARPGCPTYTEDGIEWADCRVFAVIEKVELTEVFPRIQTKGRKREPVILQPKFCHGIYNLQGEQHKMKGEYRKVLVLELAYTAVLVLEYLRAAPMVSRGRG